ncbi:uncharacterized protein LDX57_006543 [Aspergillus melleus]|uniref:uncharacterized protein n=1 Tax=Aspergillus melleus TaxID=138277 RepID=UPI001E8DFE8B|nr:uncharacterized protein LDX57_006543 [Aspergillus melleus]KAH8428866.1 hypothetical protein LDX57_006543 [Aspergillus melleus]
MIPPSDSILHHSHKLSEVQNPVQPAPPPYSKATQQNDPHEDLEGDVASDEQEQPPIATYIDSSFSIKGDENSLVIPSSSASRPASAVSPAPSVPTASATGHAAPPHRRARLGDMAASIVAALHRTGVLDGTRTPSVEVHITTGIRIEGNRNIICSGLGANRPLVGRPNASGEGTSSRKRSQSDPTETSASFKRHCLM